MDGGHIFSGGTCMLIASQLETSSLSNIENSNDLAFLFIYVFIYLLGYFSREQNQGIEDGVVW